VTAAPFLTSLDTATNLLVMNNYPALPRLDGETMLLVFTHRSIAGIHPDETYGDTDRLAALGSGVLSTVVTHHFFAKRPMLTATEIITNKEELLGDTNISNWVSIYRLMDKLRGYPREPENVADYLKESRHLFHSYVGAVYVQHGLFQVQSWISRLIDPESEPPQLPGDGQALSPATSRLSSPPPGSGDQAVAASPGVTLALFNQTATQRGLKVSYPAEFSGPSHNPRWIVKCMVNDVEKGRGVGKNQKIAKEDAARQAWAALGWGP